MILVDTSAWFASVVTSEIDYPSATHWLATQPKPLLTTDFIIDETLTLLRARGQHAIAIALGSRFFGNQLATIYYLTQDDIHTAWEIFRSFSDKAWSCTDCTSKVVIDKLALTTAFAFDHHFRQFGNIQVVPTLD